MIYAKKVETTDSRFKDRNIILTSSEHENVIPVPDTVVLCNSCNRNIYPDAGYLVYLDKQDLADDLPYDFYCEDCTKKYFPKRKEVACCGRSN